MGNGDEGREDEKGLVQGAEGQSGRAEGASEGQERGATLHAAIVSAYKDIVAPMLRADANQQADRADRFIQWLADDVDPRPMSFAWFLREWRLGYEFGIACRFEIWLRDRAAEESRFRWKGNIDWGTAESFLAPYPGSPGSRRPGT